VGFGWLSGGKPGSKDKQDNEKQGQTLPENLRFLHEMSLVSSFLRMQESPVIQGDPGSSPG
jgi:hypothetical protein